MNFNKLGDTGINVSAICMGGHEYLPDGRGSRGFNEDMSLATKPGYLFEGFGNQKRTNILKTAVELGINFFDVTMDSEKEAIGRNMKDITVPYKYYIQTRPEGMVYTYDPYNVKMGEYETLKGEVLRILKLINREKIDFFNIAPMKAAFDHDSQYLNKLCDNIKKLKAEGLISYACADTFSGEETYLKMINSRAFDVLYINFNFADDKALLKVLPRAKELNMGIIARETYMKGNLFKMAKEAGIENTSALASAALKWCFSFGYIDTVVYGTGNENHLRGAAKIAGDGNLTAEESALLEKIKETPLYKLYKENKDKEFLA